MKRMAGIDLEKLNENIKALEDFAYRTQKKRWYKYCKKHRNDKHDVEELEKLKSSICDANPWRLIVDVKSFDTLALLMVQEGRVIKAMATDSPLPDIRILTKRNRHNI